MSSEFLCPADSACGHRVFIEAGRFVTVCVIPFVKAFETDMGTVGAVLKHAQAIVAPRSCQIDGFFIDTLCACERAVMKAEAFRLGKRMGGSGSSGSGCPHGIRREDLHRAQGLP